MNYMQYIQCDDANGTGVRCTIFVAGCEMACVGCHNPSSWKLNAGTEYTKKFEDKIIEDLKSPYINGLSISGGNPTHIKNFETVLNLCKRVKSETGKSIWMWTGMTFEELQSDGVRKEILSWVDTVITGRFELDKKEEGLLWKGSSNQEVINVKEVYGAGYKK